MNVLVFGSGNEADEFIDLLNSHKDFIFRKKCFILCHNISFIITCVKIKCYIFKRKSKLRKGIKGKFK